MPGIEALWPIQRQHRYVANPFQFDEVHGVRPLQERPPPSGTRKLHSNLRNYYLIFMDHTADFCAEKPRGFPKTSEGHGNKIAMQFLMRGVVMPR
jgi:hypothetical protein